MRDFTNDGEIHVHGDMRVGDGDTNEFKLFTQCDNETLRQELPFRQENDRLEQALKWKKSGRFFGVSISLFIIAATWATLQGHTDLQTFSLGVTGILIAWKTLEVTLNPNAFQREERAAVAEIKKILRQRRAN